MKDGPSPSSTAVLMHSEGKVVKLTFAFLPHKCALTGRHLWFERAYKSVEKYSGYGDNRQYHQVTYTHWIDKKEYIMWKLKQ